MNRPPLDRNKDCKQHHHLQAALDRSEVAAEGLLREAAAEGEWETGG